jgi:hypothetical protein
MPQYTIPEGSPDILGHKAGETFEADIPAAQEARLVARGQLQVSGGLGQMPREKLDEMARALNLNPDQFANKPALIDAITAKTPKEQ